jgi:hypothetical protein
MTAPRYRVTHGYVTVETAVTAEGARARVDIQPGQLLPPDVPAAEAETLLRQGRVAVEAPPEGGGEGSGSGPEDLKPPARSASKAAWAAWADSQDPADHASMTKEQLIEQYGGGS